MGKLRVYELAKELGISSKRLIELLENNGVKVKNHMSTIEADDALKIKAQLRGEDQVETKTSQEETKKKEYKEPEKKKREKPVVKAVKEKKTTRKARKEEKKADKKVTEKENIITIEGGVTPREIAEVLELSASEVISKLMELGVMATINQHIDSDVVVLIGEEFGKKIEIKEDPDEAELISALSEHGDPKDLKPRPPVVTVLGHVDHGKTSLLDAIRKTNVIAHEAGGITQHIGAYQVNINGKKVTFLDTPGHEAFTAMRARGAKVTDIAILVVAADDGVMPQTVEAINHVKAAGVPIIVAINKIDKESANPDRVKQQLAEYGLIPEEWGGDTVFVHVSALKKQGLKDLLEMILLVAELADLKANPNKKAVGTVIEARLDKGRGVVATVLVTDGTLQIADPIICGNISGKVKAMSDYKGKRIKKAGPSTPVEVLGLSEVPEAGDILQVVADEKLARQISEKRLEKKREIELKRTQKVTLEDFFDLIQKGETKDLNIILKADVHGSVEALKDSLLKLDSEEVKVNVLHSGVGAVTESDVMLAAASKAIIIGFNVSPHPVVRKIADNENVEIRLYRVIYEAIEDIKKAIKGMLAPQFKEKILGHAEVRQLFKVSKVGTIAGCHVVDGKVTRQASVRIIRDGVVIYEGNLASLKRFKDDVREVAAGFDCGLMIDKFNDLSEKDIIEAYTLEKIQPE